VHHGKSVIKKTGVYFSYIVRTIGLGMLADTFSSENLGSIIGSVMISHTVGFTLGPLIGGYLYEWGGMTSPFYFCALFAVFIFIGTLAINEPAKGEREEVRVILKRSDKNEFMQLVKNYRIIVCIICTCVTAAGLSGIEPALAIYLKERYQVSTFTMGAIFIALVVPSFFGPITGYLSDKVKNLLLFVIY
jgi:MFS family permease